MKTRHCDECKFCDFRKMGEMTCGKGHKPRFYMPRDKYPYLTDWGWKRKCADYEKGEPRRAEYYE